MKKQFLLSLIFTFFCGIIYGQHLIRVNNDPAADADYTTLQDAHDYANAGDTIYVEGSAANYTGPVIINKRLTIIGPGYFLADNDSTQANSLDAELASTMEFSTGSRGTEVKGMIISSIYIKENEIVIARCYVGSIIIFGDSNNSLITQNYINTSISSMGYKLTNSIISNNIIGGGIAQGSTSYPLQITNNVIRGSTNPVNVYNSTISNNIITGTSYKVVENTGNNIINNLFAYAGTNANGNVYNVSMTTVFVDFNGTLGYSEDERYKLKTLSPAIGAGVSGVDCGVFGGVTPYVLSGMPPFPHIYEATIPGTAYSDKGLSCIIKVKSGK